MYCGSKLIVLGNILGDEGAQSIAQMLRENFTLTALDLSSMYW